jgi:hypothetical protein
MCRYIAAHWRDFSTGQDVNSQRAAQQAVAEHGEDDQCDNDVGQISLERKGYDRKDHASDRRGYLVPRWLFAIRLVRRHGDPQRWGAWKIHLAQDGRVVGPRWFEIDIVVVPALDEVTPGLSAAAN